MKNNIVTFVGVMLGAMLAWVMYYIIYAILSNVLYYFVRNYQGMPR